MTRDSTYIKQQIVIEEFQRLLRSGNDLTANSMYEDAGKKCFLERNTAGNMIRKYYREQITEDMRIFVLDNKNDEFSILLELFCKKFDKCKREGRLMIGYIHNKKNIYKRWRKHHE